MTTQPLAYLLAMLGSALGGGARLYVSTLVSRGLGSQFPWGTLAVNLAGCLLVGDPAYYSRFGFRPATGLEYPGVPPEYFMAVSFGAALPQGVATFHAAFGATA